MSFSIARCFLVSFALAGWIGCGGPPPAPDAAPSMVPASPAGAFAVVSTFDLRLPAAAQPAMAALTAATDGPDDPSRFVIDRMIEGLPDGSAKTIAKAVAPYVAAYVNARLNEIAPRFVGGLAGIATGLSRIATHVGTLETLQIDAGGTGVRTIHGVRFEVGGAVTVVHLAEAGLADISAAVRAVLDATGQLAISEHAHGLPYGAILRLGLDRAVVPSVQPGARDLAEALGALLDCARLGALVAERVGLGSAALYAAACQTAMTAAASEVDARLAAIDQIALGIEVAGTVHAVDHDGDGTIDELTGGRWTGAVYTGQIRELIDAASFAGTAAR
ncbi:MAG: hypothetical protein E6J90_29570 [Deltaproteobacteria bacterium]|nr:MAG: hypothetical protein E6J90_29570 [Deltaproteobacteria bacterium]TMQ20163.1 MAG: hypothetical protein E6J91_04480 [Deltaproteobacteria bacterium]